MSKTAYVRARVEPALKNAAENIFHELGMTTSQVINMFYKQVIRNGEIPLELHVPNKETARAIKEARAGKGIKEFSSVDELFKELDL